MNPRSSTYYPLITFILLTYCCNIALASNDIPLEKDPQYYASLQDQLSDGRESKDYRKIADAYYHLGLYDSRHSDTKRNVTDYYNRSIEYYKILNQYDQMYEVRTAMAEEFLRNNLKADAKEILNENLSYYSDSSYVDIRFRIRGLLLEIALSEDNIIEYETQLEKLSELSVMNDSLGLLTRLYEIKGQVHISNIEWAKKEIEQNILKDSIALSSKDSLHMNLLISEIYIKSQNKSSALFYLDQVYKEVAPLPLNIDKLAYLSLAKQLYLSSNQYDSTYYFAEKEMMLNDSIMDRSRLESISKISEQFKSKEKSTAIKILELEKTYNQETNDQQRRALYVLGLLASILLLSIYFTVRFYSQQLNANGIIASQNEELSKQKIQTLQDELNLKSMHSMIEGQESERERISKDLHDSLGGLLSSIKLQLEHIPIETGNKPAKQKQEQVQSLLDYAVGEVRNISSNLQPTALKNLGLVPALNDLFNRAEGKEYPEIEFQHYNVPKLKNMVALSIYRIVQELLNNTIKHAKANEVFIQIRQEDNQLVLQYEDDGIGFDLETLKRKGMGLENITSRVNYLKGEMSIDARVGEGVSYLIHVDV